MVGARRRPPLLSGRRIRICMHDGAARPLKGLGAKTWPAVTWRSESTERQEWLHVNVLMTTAQLLQLSQKWPVRTGSEAARAGTRLGMRMCRGALVPPGMRVRHRKLQNWQP